MKTATAFVAAVTIACTTSNNPDPQTIVESCELACSDDSACPSGQTCGDLRMCTAGDACEVGRCTPREVLACNDDGTARVCDEAGTGAIAEACSFGCNAEAKRCNECTPGAQVCLADGVLETCSADGRVEATETCELGCIDSSAAAPAHCGRIQPAWIPSVCDARIGDPKRTIQSTTINTSDDVQCTGGIIQQTTPAGPEICVVRHSSIEILGDVRVKGTRAIAFVADHELRLDTNATLDVSATSGGSGPGGGFTVSGAAPSLTGGGGAGFRQTGANGGGTGETPTTFGIGGGAFDPLARLVFEGGARATSATSNGAGEYTPAGGGGGGALQLVSCEGTVFIQGRVVASGGGGGGGGDTLSFRNGFDPKGGAGGGAGGYVVLQGAKVWVFGASLFANGGGGGGGCSTDQCVAPAGKDGAVAGVGGTGGSGVTARGGTGGTGTVAPTVGQNSMTNSPGGGGGSTGRFQVYTPAGVVPALQPLVVQPPFEPSRNVPVR